ncbi:PaaI family thioesterase [Zavarzinia aquatilis]|uniref:Thioesterase n=1 Tax=Zavarzinia aquatilis TaxID=2211142 RepID=A0A317E340_9PROT|nr:PaaI family thioesterase [Zavarzinia aquatilis]PWR21457.1 thioesterase [Zavarzinia aquatilis]
MSDDTPKLIGELIGDNLQVLLSAIPFSMATGMSVAGVGPARATLTLPWREDLVGDPRSGILHGGMITALIDAACGTAVICSLTKMISIATLDLRIDYLRPATPGETVIVDAEVYRSTRSIAFVRALAHHGDKDRAVAHAVATFMLGANKAPINRGIASEVAQNA